MTTQIGKYMRALRLRHSEILKDMAANLGVSSAFLSAVENGKKKFPEGWYEKFQCLYELSAEEMNSLRQAVLESSDSVELNLKNATAGNRKLAISFARTFDSLDEETSHRIFEILNDQRKE